MGGHGWLGVIYNPDLNLKLLGKSSNLVKYKTFEYTEHVLKSKQGLLRFCNIYKRPYSVKHRFTLLHFFPEFEYYLEGLVSKPGTPILLGDFNIHLECTDDINVNRFLKLIEEFSIIQNMSIDIPTHRVCSSYMLMTRSYILHLKEILIPQNSQKGIYRKMHYWNKEMDVFDVIKVKWR